MKVYFFIFESFPGSMAAAKRRMCYIKGLKSENIDCEIIICHKTENKKTTEPIIGIFEGIKYRYICGRTKSSYKIIRAIDYLFLDYLKCICFFIKKVDKKNISYCYFYNNFFYLLLLITAKFKKVKTIRELCEYPHIFGKQNLLKKAARWFELNLLFPLFDGFIPISTELNKLAIKYKSSKAQTLIIPILVDETEQFQSIEKEQSPYSNPYILHTGTMSEQKDGIIGILQAFAIAIKEIKFPIKLVFTGSQAKYPNEYEQLIEKLELKNHIIMAGMLPASEITRYQQYASLAIINKNDNLQNRNCFPTKLGEMLLSGTAVITTTVGDANLFLKDNESAYIVEPNKPLLIAEKIIQAFKYSQERDRIASNGKEIAKKYFNCAYQGKRLSLFYMEILNKKK